MAERGVAGAEPVKHQRRAHLPHPLQQHRRIFRILHHQAFGDRELERSALGVVPAQCGAHVGQKVVAQQLARGRGDGGENRRVDLERLLPGGELARRRVENICADVDHHPGRLRNRGELVLVENAEPRMAPAGQRLKPGDGPILQPDDRPEQHHDLAPLDRMAQVVFERPSVGGVGAHRRDEQNGPVAARLLRIGEGELRVGEQFPALDVLLRIVERGPDRHRQRNLPFAEAERRGERGAQALERSGKVARRRLGQNDRAELVPGEPRQRVARLQVARQAARDGEQRGVAHRQAEGIVDPLEAVDVDGEHRRRRRARLLREIERRRQPVLEQLAVGKAGQIVVDGVVEHALFGRLDFRDVRQRADHPHDLSVGADHRPRLQHVPEVMAVRAAQPQIVVDPAGALMQEPVERQGVAVAVERMEDVEPAGGRPLEGMRA